MNGVTTAPISFEHDLSCSPADAFAAYTGRIAEWRNPRYTANAAARPKFGDWSVLPDRFAAIATGGS
jgi:hypothetical protein